VIGARGGTPEPAHEVVAQLDARTEIRRYAPAAVVEAPMSTGRNGAFGLLFGYISGANDGGAKIAMTAPVATDEAGATIAMTAPVAVEGGAMRFFLPAGMDAATAPRPTDLRLTVRDVPARLVAVRRFSGLRTEASITEESAALAATLEGAAWAPAGAAEAWFYDPPWTLPPFRRNEIAAPVARR
jgi:hypothetical protein